MKRTGGVSLFECLVGLAACGFVVAGWQHAASERAERFANQTVVATLYSLQGAVTRWQATDRSGFDVNGFNHPNSSTPAPDNLANFNGDFDNLLELHMASEHGFGSVVQDNATGYVIGDRMVRMMSGVDHGAGTQLALMWSNNGVNSPTLEAHLIGNWTDSNRAYLSAALPSAREGSLRRSGTVIDSFHDEGCDSDGDGNDDLANCFGTMYLAIRHVAAAHVLNTTARSQTVVDESGNLQGFVSPLVFDENEDTIVVNGEPCIAVPAIPATLTEPAVPAVPVPIDEIAWNVYGIPMHCSDGAWRPAIYGTPVCRDIRLPKPAAGDPIPHAPGYIPVIHTGWIKTAPASPPAFTRPVRTFATVVGNGADERVLCPDGFATETVGSDSFCVRNLPSTADHASAQDVCVAAGGTWCTAFQGCEGSCSGEQGSATHQHECKTPKAKPPWNPLATAADEIFVAGYIEDHVGSTHRFLRRCEPSVPPRPAHCIMDGSACSVVPASCPTPAPATTPTCPTA